ncbi:hypothetical protein C0991_012470 [Blastosporella zonata]|nr:hypothetical protein C0991_012470 [Blastosporella zonata]
MAASFAFIPRTLAKGKRKTEQNTTQATTSSTPAQTTSTSQSAATSGSSTRAKFSNEDYVNLFGLALSDYALWADSDLRRTIDWSSEPSSDEQGADGFFPLSHLLKRSKVLGPLNLEGSQVPIAKALRLNDATSVVEVRLLMSEPSASTWSSKRDTARDLGAYEVRRRDLEGGITRASKNYSKQDWENRTVYVENMPAPYRTVPAILDFINTLIAARQSSNSASIRVQGIILPPHHQDKPGDAPTCKGFALIVLQDELDVDFLLETWRWDRQRSADAEHTQPEEPTEIQDAAKFGFRTLSKSRWDQLKEEYLSYRERLVGEINAHQDAEVPIPVPVVPIPIPIAPPAPKPLVIEEPPVPEGPSKSKLNYSSPFPFDSLIFVRNIHPETNKTTLRKFFASAFEVPLAKNEIHGDGLDYVDFNKGRDSCHLRLATPKHANILVDHFLVNPMTQARGLDEVGSPLDGTHSKEEGWLTR